MATRLNKKVLLVALLGAFGLTACGGEVEAYPKDGSILPPAQGQEIYHNSLESIYESIRNGSLASDVLEKLLYEYANTVFGRYSKSAPSYRNADEEEVTLSEIVNGSLEQQEAFVKAHKAYWPGEEEPAGEEMATAVARMKAIAKSVEDRIAEALYSKIAGGSYSEHNIFSEEKFLAALFLDGKKVEDYAKEGLEFYEGIIDPEVKSKDVFSHFLHKDYYYSDAHTYAITENIESIYKSLLTEQYIIDESYSTLGRSYARRVNVLAVKVDDSSKADVPALVDYVLENYIVNKDGLNPKFVTTTDKAKQADEAVENVKKLYGSVSNIMRGLPKYFDELDDEYDEVSKTIVDELYANSGNVLYGNTADLVDGKSALTSTEYGSLMKDISKLDEDLAITDTSVESTLTGNGAYTIEKGIEYKGTEIELKNYITEGWFIKNGGLSTLPDTIRNRLFNISVSNALDNDTLVDRSTLVQNDEWDAEAYDEEIANSKYVAKVNGAYFLKTDTVEDKASNKDLYFYEKSSNTYYFVQIAEAVNPTKLSSGSGNYTELYNVTKQEDIARAVCKVVGEISSYSTLAKDHWLEKMELEYHDDAVYEYFKTNYPKLFE